MSSFFSTSHVASLKFPSSSTQETQKSNPFLSFCPPVLKYPVIIHLDLLPLPQQTVSFLSITQRHTTEHKTTKGIFMQDFDKAYGTAEER